MVKTYAGTDVEETVTIEPMTWDLVAAKLTLICRSPVTAKEAENLILLALATPTSFAYPKGGTFADIWLPVIAYNTART